MNSQIAKEEVGLHNLSIRNGQYPADVLLENSRSYQNSKFQKSWVRNYGTTITKIVQNAARLYSHKLEIYL